MADLQSFFNKFHEIIKLDNFGENSTLRDKRTIVLDKLKEQLKQMHEDDETIPKTFDWFNQGSYAMGTGINPEEEDYDIDIGINFDVSSTDFTPVQIKRWVYNALLGHTKEVLMKKPCITVQYQKNNEKTFHVDLALYVKQPESFFNGDKLYFSMGKNADDMLWEDSEPKKLIKSINSVSTDSDEKLQFKRIVRYLKYWSKEKFTQDGNSAPPSIGLTISTYNWISFNKNNDINTLIDLIGSIISNFSSTFDENFKLVSRLEAKLPTLPNNDVFGKMSNNQMANFKNKLETLKSKLIDAKNETDPYEACLKLQKVFGDKFPAEKKETAKKTNSTSNWGSTNNANLIS